MRRREFSKAVKIAIIRRSTRDGMILCEACGAMAKKWQIDHVRADGLLGDPTLENAQLLGKCCYAAKNADDTTNIAKAKRREARSLGIRTAPVRPLESAPFPVSERTVRNRERGSKTTLDRRPMFVTR